MRLILDLACGVGRDTQYLESRGFSTIGVDASVRGLRAAQRRACGKVSPAFVAADARRLPFRDGAFDGAHFFGLLHEFTDPTKDQDVSQVMVEIERVLPAGGALALAVLAGDPEDGLPAVRLFTREMFDRVTTGWRPAAVQLRDDIGCTDAPSYRVWFGMFEK